MRSALHLYIPTLVVLALAGCGGPKGAEAPAATAKDEDAWLEFKKTYLDLETEAEYQEAVRKR